MSRIKAKWRPPLAFVMGGTLAAVLCLPLIGIVWFRLAGNILGWGETGWLIFWMAVVSTAVLAFLLWRLVLRPVARLTDYARAVREGRRDATPPEHFGTPEFGALGASVIAMGDTLQSRAASLRAYADHVTHELKSPLTSLRGAAELLQSDLPARDQAQLIDTIETSAARMQALLTQLQRHAAASQSSGAGQTQVQALPATVGDMQIVVEQDGTVPLSLGDLTVVIDQMAQNAAAHGATRLMLACRGQRLHIADDGRGIGAGNAGRIFDPFFTTRRDAGGTGMGLTIVQTLLSAHGARIALDDQVTGGGAAFVIYFD
ncbi:ATP-binding protein [uncultured Pseudosulfitobacter sp.]|uniref:ATP-binding protein n=1 Tax=uncultured Pseudosulfitobacter sp. TaxID=2854214 RepID=UPI0030D7677C|tara:strand:- start:1784 stop:2734 length:951 start_codon:yes stop_codon:yes gene_type:complete